MKVNNLRYKFFFKINFGNNSEQNYINKDKLPGLMKGDKRTKGIIRNKT